ncbi:MAG: allantoinase AllB [Gemmatimonadaceae bacterium]
MSERADLVVRARRVITADGSGARALHIRGGVIAAVAEHDDVPAAARLIDVGDRVIMPGLVDTHVHCNEPGRTQWEGFRTATRAAAAGGITTIVDMPLNSIPATTTVAALEAKRAAARGQCAVDVGFWGGVVPGNARDLAPLVAAGVLGFKCFLVPSGVDEFGAVGERELREAMPILRDLGVPLLVHAEVPGPIARGEASVTGRDRRSYATWLDSRPDAAEVEAFEMMASLSEELGTRVHIVHLATDRVLPLLRAARARGVPISAETCPHYLHFAAEEIADGATEYKCAPPIRRRDRRGALLAALAGDLSMIVSDHSPCPPEMKMRETGDFMRAWGGIASLQLGLSIAWTDLEPVHYELDDIARLMCAAPAKLAGLGDSVGALAVGRDANFIVFDPRAAFTVDAQRLEHRHKLTPYDGARLRGVVEQTWLRGEPIFDRGAFAGQPRGRLVGS